MTILLVFIKNFFDFNFLYIFRIYNSGIFFEIHATHYPTWPYTRKIATRPSTNFNWILCWKMPIFWMAQPLSQPLMNWTYGALAKFLSFSSVEEICFHVIVIVIPSDIMIKLSKNIVMPLFKGNDDILQISFNFHCIFIFDVWSFANFYYFAIDFTLLIKGIKEILVFMVMEFLTTFQIASRV